MIENTSPWIAQLKRSRKLVPLEKNTSADIAIIGGGIAGVLTAYFTLSMTKKTVVLLEAGKVAHGATGHNAGQVVHYFERPFSEIVQEFGLEKAGDAQNAILSAWDLLDDIYDNCNLQTPIHRFTGYAGVVSQEDLYEHLENKYLRHQAGIHMEDIAIAEDVEWLKEIPNRYKGLYSTLPRENIHSLLETHHSKFIALLSTQKAVVNSALFTEEVTAYLLKQYPTRFELYEQTPVKTVSLDKNDVELFTENHTVKAKKVVLCTNGFENFTIENKNGFLLNHKFHDYVRGKIGYMAGYLETLDKSPIAISYFKGDVDNEGIPIYYYLTRRPYEMEQNQKHNLVCIGGPEMDLPEKKLYDSSVHEFKQRTLKNIDSFLGSTYKPYPKDTVELIFHWHGLMGYTKNNLRLIGMEPCNTNLFYNLGCNGVGILPSIYGAKRIGQLLRGDKLKASIFDPVDTRCMIK